MSKKNSEIALLSELFTDAAREVVEKNRIKAQMNKLNKVMEVDNRRLQSLYAEIGQMYCDGTLEKYAGKVEMIKKAMAHLKLRLERAEARMKQLKAAHSVDECTEAFKAQLKDSVQKAQQATTEYARGIGEKVSESMGDGKVANAAAKAKITAEEIVARAVAAARKVKDKKALAKDTEVKGSAWTGFDGNLDEDDFDEDDYKYIDEYSDEDVAAAADIGAILENIAFALEEVENEVADTAQESEEVQEETTDAKDDASEESPESFTF